MSKDVKLSKEDVQLFRDTVGDIRPLKNPLHNSKPEPAQPVPRQRIADEQSVMSELLTHPLEPEEVEMGEELEYLRQGLQKKILRSLKRGKYSVQDTVDLHHMNQQAAKSTLLEFIRHARRQDYRCIKVIHGKGLRSGNDGPKLKAMVNRILRRHSQVLAFASARPNDGGTGAIYLLLSKDD